MGKILAPLPLCAFALRNKMDWNFIIFSVVKIAVVIGVVQGLVAYTVLAERKISAWIQDRVGPNRTAPQILHNAIPNAESFA